MPVLQSIKFELVINAETAQMLGLRVHRRWATLTPTGFSRLNLYLVLY
jgi:hypothetical protein